jgi:hypothetical protein
MYRQLEKASLMLYSMYALHFSGSKIGLAGCGGRPEVERERERERERGKEREKGERGREV